LLIERQKKRVKFLVSSQMIEIKKQKHGRKFSGKAFSSPTFSKSLNRKGLEPAGKFQLYFCFTTRSVLIQPNAERNAQHIFCPHYKQVAR